MYFTELDDRYLLLTVDKEDIAMEIEVIKAHMRRAGAGKSMTTTAMVTKDRTK